MLIRAVAVEARENYRIWLRYEDGAEGEVDLSDLVGRGDFTALEDRAFFESVAIGEFGEIRWGEEIDLDPYMLYMRLTGKTPGELFPNLGETRTSEATRKASGA